MGHMRHHAIIVTSWDAALMEEAYERAAELFPVVSPLLDSEINGYQTIFIPPDGSKEGWDESNAGDERRHKFLDWLKQRNSERGGEFYKYVEVQYGDDEGHNLITRDSCKDW